MKRRGKIILAVLCVLMVAAGIFVYRQWDNIMVLASIGKYSTEEIEEMRRENTQVRTEAVADIQVRELTAEEKLAIQTGELSQEDALALITSVQPSPSISLSSPSAPSSSSATPLPSPTGEDKPTASQTPESTPQASSTHQPAEEPAQDYNAELAKLVGEIYIMEASYSGKLEELLNSAIEEYKSLPPEKHTTTSKLNIGARYLGVAEAMERSCDEQMATLLREVEGVLIAAGKDTTLVREIKTAYQSEKTLTKDYYMSLYA